jgi:sigma-B regulation protein RsbU (phosphoserine phosphatase)
MPASISIVGPQTETERLRSLLEGQGFEIIGTFADASRLDPIRTNVTILIGPSALLECQKLSLRPIEERLILLVVAANENATARAAALAHGADAVLPPRPTSDELAGQIRALVRWHRAVRLYYDRAVQSQFTTHKLQAAYRQVELDLAAARRLQASFLPQLLPAVGPVRFGVSYRPCGQVGGDFYDVIRLDEHHIGFYLADAMGHGVPASLLTIFLKKAVQPKEISESSYRLVPPQEVLVRLNRDLMAQGLAEMPFITMIYGLIDCRSGSLQFSRAAHPHPVYLPSQGEPEQWQTPGTLLGVFEAEYPQIQREMARGDKLLLFTDGLSESGHDAGPVLTAALEHREMPIQSLVDRVSNTVLADAKQPDDFTLLGLELVA